MKDCPKIICSKIIKCPKIEHFQFSVRNLLTCFFLEMPNFKYARKSWNVSFSNHLTYLNWTDSRAKYILHMFWDISRNHIIWFTTHVLGFLSQYFFIQWNSLSQTWIRRPWLLGRVFERMTLSHQNVWILGNIYTVFQFRVPSNDHNKIEIYIAKSIFLSDIGNFLLPDGIFDLEKPYLTSLWAIIMTQNLWYSMSHTVWGFFRI